MTSVMQATGIIQGTTHFGYNDPKRVIAAPQGGPKTRVTMVRKKRYRR